MFFVIRYVKFTIECSFFGVFKIGLTEVKVSQNHVKNFTVCFFDVSQTIFICQKIKRGQKISTLLHVLNLNFKHVLSFN